MKKRLFLILPVFLLLLFIYGPNLLNYFSLKLTPYGNSFYSISLENGETLFGNIKSFDGRWIVLANVYYFQSLDVNENTTKNLVPQSSNALTSPENYMALNRSKVVAIEKVGEKAKILEIINKN